MSAPTVDVEACVRLLKRVASQLRADGALGMSADGDRLDALASALPGMGKDSERWRAFTAQHSLAHHYSWDRKPNSQLIILEDGFITLGQLADRLRAMPPAARAAQPEETSADAET